MKNISKHEYYTLGSYGEGEPVDLDSLEGMKEMHKVIISGFPGIGKTYLKQNNPQTIIADSDSSEYSWIVNDDGQKVRNPDFPKNYIQHISNLYEDDDTEIILVSTHKDVREGLELAELPYIIVYPAKELKEQYLSRFERRGSPDAFLQVLSENWDAWIQDIENEEYGGKFKFTQPWETLNAVFFLGDGDGQMTAIDNERSYRNRENDLIVTHRRMKKNASKEV